MSNTQVEIAEGCTTRSGPRLVEDGEYPFFSDDGTQLDIHCLHSEFFCCTLEETSGGWVGVVQLARRGGGIMAGFDADGLREMATQLNAMADYMDRENNGNG